MPISRKPVLAVTMGDPAGIGPEIIAGAWSEKKLHDQARPVVVGHPEVMRRAVRLLERDVKICEIHSLESWSEVLTDSSTIPCINVCDGSVLAVPRGTVDPRAGEAAYQAVCFATKLALEQKVDGVVTAPLSKAALHAAGHHYPGHTELLAELCHVTDYAMMLYLPPGNMVKSPTGLGVAHVTLHQSLRSIFADVTPSAIVAKCRLADKVMRRLGAEQPRLAVCALNPHAGENGLFGDEEIKIIAPAAEEARQRGLDVRGPFPADTLMLAARDGEFDAVIALYHDQGHIALKLLGMHAAVNITLGLPIVRTSVAHGTAFDLAWQGKARWEGMVAAMLTAVKLVA